MYKSCVKNVFSLFILSGIFCDFLYTKIIQFGFLINKPVFNYRFIQNYIHKLLAIFSTMKSIYFNLLKFFYSHNPHNLLLLKLINK